MSNSKRLAFVLGVATALGAGALAAQEKPAAMDGKAKLPIPHGVFVKPAEDKATPQSKARLPGNWAYRPLAVPAVPAVKDKHWARTDIDRFVLARLEEAKLKPSPEADRSTLIRRVYLDVTGVIPKPEEVRAFVNDRSPDAYEKLVDRLLASPQYGERIGRRWLDLARYADTQGFQDDEQRPGMWRYRDYVIKSFNQDKPFNQFVREQIAGDELWPGKQEALVATGFLRGYPDAPDHRDLLEKRYNSITDMTDTVGTALLGHPVECARCHDHKFDKVSQKEYFQLQAFFTNTLPSDNLPVIEKGERELKFEKDYAAWEEETKDVRGKLAAFVEPYRGEVVEYGRQRFYEDSRASLYKPESEWKSLDRWINYRFDQYVIRNNPNYGFDISFYAAANGAFNNALEVAQADPGFDKDKLAKLKSRKEDYGKLYGKLKDFNDKRPVQGATIISGLTEHGTDAAPQFVYAVGDHHKPLEEVQPAFPALFTPGKTEAKIVPTATSSGRRSALANWLVSEDNAVVPRVFVNRVWAQYLDNGIVSTVSDFGRAGQKPTHPELLDYLAEEFVKNGWSAKRLSREILLSSVYRQSSAERKEVAAADPYNKLLAQFPRKRLETEQVRDSLLAAAGLLTEKDGGPGAFPPLPEVIYKASARNVPDFWPQTKDDQDQYSRSVYVYVRRSLPYPMLEAFDSASPQAAHSRRDVTTTPQQSLTLFNNEQVFEWSKHLAGRVIREAGGSEDAQLDRLYQVLYSRTPDLQEKQIAKTFLKHHEGVIREQLTSGKFAVATPTGLKDVPNVSPTRLAAFVDLAHALSNTNEFIYRF
ncbi:DUF1549 domain-containing protein [Solimonas sp. K1W22B-7]|uniref:DUF1549 and DUF1553 domain-containing protein n=1 Tax=Solimonas sp. K1W22B-7 TaxID=2303331 RepID=UPI000E33771A|nr:DUF1549 and DUF1553 domain-containing protein [Solimonas sp. K1W22B-7]AXQ28474.1 DUF1549 domain-containing protein [Solimonas sp. K1W22B-7]